jgi:urea transporter/murein DD-endopeptidase MepM/ murein hydrolase activator NlpD
VVTFFDYVSGLAGLLAIVISNLVAWLIGLNIDKIKKGFYGFNSLLVGLGLGLFFSASHEFWLILAFSSLLTLFLTIAFEGILAKYYLPYLSLPFLFGIWLVFMAVRDYTSLEISDRGVYLMNEMYILGGMNMVRIYEWFNTINLPPSLIIYFRSLGAILFQYHLFPGLLIDIGLLLYSRIAFSLSLLGFYVAYIFYNFVGADLTTLSYTYIGFNFILTAIAIGGFYVIPSRYSYLWVIVLTPLTSILLTAFNMLFVGLQLSIYSLPFNIVVLLFIYVLKFRDRNFTKPELVVYQKFSPENNLYSQLNNKERFGKFSWFRVALPFWGEWKVTQAHNGEITHKENWKNAWDFEIFDEKGKSYSETGARVTDYYCYNKPVLAPADGWVENIAGHIEDNAIGEPNLKESWGNTIVIRHTELLYSSLSHLKKDSIKVSTGQFVKKGEIIASCGNSGRSPVPHLHFQFQSTPQIGSNTLELPLRNYIKKSGSGFQFHSSDYPQINETIVNIECSELLQKSFGFIPGREIIFFNENLQESKTFKIKADHLNNSYLLCTETGSQAYFVNENELFYFTLFEGDKKSLLYFFYLSCYKVIFGFYRGMKIEDQFPVNVLSRGIIKYVQDFIAPFYLFSKSKYKLEYIKSSDNFSSPEMHLRSEVSMELPFKSEIELSFDLLFKGNSLEQLIIYNNEKAPSEWKIQKDTSF